MLADIDRIGIDTVDQYVMAVLTLGPYGTAPTVSKLETVGKPLPPYGGTTSCS